MNVNLGSIAANYKSAFPNSTHQDRADFLLDTITALSPPPPKAQDAAMNRRHPLLSRDQAEMPPRGSSDPSDDPIQCSAEECLSFVRTLINGFTDQDEKAQFVEGLNNIISSDGELQITHLPDNNNQNGNGDQSFPNGSANMPQYGSDRSRRVTRRVSRDQLPSNNQGALDRRRRPAQDSNIQALNHQSFMRRFPGAATVKFSGTGR